MLIDLKSNECVQNKGNKTVMEDSQMNGYEEIENGSWR